MQFLLGIDVGTSGSKVLLLGTDGVLLASATVEYPFHTPKPLWAEQDPEEWWRATAEGIKAVCDRAGVAPSAVAGIGLTGQMHGLVLLDSHGAVLRPCIMWNDQRTGDQCAALTERVGAKRLLELTGNPVLPGFTAPKIVWVREHEPQVYSRVAKFLLPKDYVRFRLTGAYAGDVSDASGTSLFDVGRRRWSDEMLSAVGIPPSWLAEVTESAVVSARVSAAGARATGLLEGTPVVAGAGDQAAQAVGTGVAEEGIVSVTTGTSGVVFAASASYRIEPNGRLHAFCHAIPGMWHLMGVMLSAGGSFRWYRDTFGEPEKEKAVSTGKDPYDLLIDAARQTPPGADGLIFLPYLTGERTPYPDPLARGVFFGLTVRHTRGHCTRAVLEGVTYGLRDSLELMRALNLTVREVRASGGGAKSDFWRQMMADIFGATLNTVNTTEGAAYGAALLAGAGVGVYPSVPDACRAVVRTTGSTPPGADRSKYEPYYREFRELYPALAPHFRKIASLSHT